MGALSSHNFACPIKILHPQSNISPLEVSLYGYSHQVVDDCSYVILVLGNVRAGASCFKAKT